MKTKKILITLAIVLLAVFALAQVPGKYLSYTADRFWSNAGAIRTDNTIESYGASNALKASYNDALYATLSADSAGSLTITRASAGTLKIFTYQADALADDGTVRLPDATDGLVIVSCNAEAITAVVKADGSCVKMAGTTNTAVADTDADLDVYDGGTYAIVKNRLATTGTIRITYLYN